MLPGHLVSGGSSPFLSLHRGPGYWSEFYVFIIWDFIQPEISLNIRSELSWFDGMYAVVFVYIVFENEYIYFIWKIFLKNILKGNYNFFWISSASDRIFVNIW